MLQGIAEKYFNLNHIPFSVDIESLICSSDVYYDKDMTDVSIEFLKGLIDNTDDYINLCKRDGGYLFKLSVGDSMVMMQVEVILNKKVR